MNDINNINMNLLKYFVVAAESSSLSEVADKMGYNISTISMNLTELERQLGVTLFTRNPLKTTEIGQDIYEHVKKGFKDIKFAGTIAESKNDMSCGKITIGCPSHITQFFLMEHLVQALNDYENLRIELDCESSCKELINRLKDSEIDFVVSDFILTDDTTNLDIKKILECEYVFVAKDKIGISNLEDLNNYRYILSYNNRNSILKLHSCLEKHNIKLDSSIKCPTTEMRIEAAKKGAGIAYVIKDAVKKELENGELYEVEMPIELPKVTINLITLKGYLTKVAKKFIKEYIQENIK